MPLHFTPTFFKIGTPVKKVAISKKATSTWTSANYTIVEKNGQKTKVYPKYTDKLKAKKNTFKLMNGRNMVIKASVSPKKATRKSLKWSTNKGSVLKVVGNGTKATVIARKVGKANVIAQATDGSGKKAVVKVTVTKFVSDKTPAPTAEPDTRKKTMVEDFESYEVGTKWERFTAGGFANSGTMTVVQDPEDSTNKCLKITYDGADQAFDFAPVFQADLSKLKDSEGKSTDGRTLGSYAAIGFDARIVSNDPSSVQYKKAYCYFDQADAIKASDYFAANANSSASAHVDKDGNAVAAGAANEYKPLRFGVNVSMAEGSDKEGAIKLYNGESSKESNKYFPFAYSTWEQANAATHFAKDSCTAGFKDSETDPDMKVGFAKRTLALDKTRINEADSTLLNQGKFDFVIGSTYDGGSKYKINNVFVTMYLDNVALIEDEIPITGFELSAGDNPRVAPGGTLTVTAKYTPEDTTQKGLIWTTDNDKVVVDANGTVTVKDDFVFAAGEMEKKVNITATSTVNPSLTKSVAITVYQVKAAETDYEVDLSKLVPTKASDTSDEKVYSEVQATVNADGSITIPYTKVNQSIVIELPETMDLNKYKGLSITGSVAGQMAVELYGADLDMSKENWYKLPTESANGANCWTWYPFYKGSWTNRVVGTYATVDDYMKAYPNADRAAVEAVKKTDGTVEDGTPFGTYGSETLEAIWKDGAKVGGLSSVKYVIVKTNQKPDNGDDIYDEDTKVHAPYTITRIAFMKKDAAADVESPSVETPAN